MKNLILLAISIFTVSCSKNSQETVFTPQVITPILIAKGNLMGTENIIAQNIVYYDTATWNSVLDSIDQYRLSTFTETTTVDFNNFQIIAVFDNVYSKPTYIVTILGVVENSSNIEVSYQKVYTPSISSSITQNYHIVKIPKSNKPVVFELQQ